MPGPLAATATSMQAAAAARGERFGHRDGLGAQRQAVAGVLDIGPDDHRPVGEAQRRPDPEVRVRRVGVLHRFARGADQFIAHGCTTTHRSGVSLASVRSEEFAVHKVHGRPA